jgi:predicted DNA-binding transcriptional regulator AlpA
MKPPVADPRPLWRLSEVAAYLNLAPKVATRCVAVPTFPRPIRFPNGRGSVSHPRWRPEEVEAWAVSYQEAEHSTPGGLT